MGQLAPFHFTESLLVRINLIINMERDNGISTSSKLRASLAIGFELMNCVDFSIYIKICQLYSRK